MRSRLKHWLGNVALALGALVMTLAFFELVVFRNFLLPDDVLTNVSENGVVRYEPGRTAIFRHPDGRTSRATISQDGWNSTLPVYHRARTPGRLRIAVIGDSYVHASYVDSDKAFPEVIARRIAAKGTDVEVFRFGMDGAPLSQHLHVMQREVLRYKPDLVLVQLIHNDFDESYRYLKTRYASSFLKIDVEEDGRVHRYEPSEFKSSIADLLRASAMFRYLYYETNLYLSLRSLVSRYFWGGNDVYEPDYIISGIDVRNLDDVPRVERVTRHIVGEMKKLADAGHFKLALSIDGVRETIYGRNDNATRKVAELNRIAADAARLASVPLFDLTETFRNEYILQQRRFEYPYDWHWNEPTNVLVGETLADWMMRDPRLLGLHEPAAQLEPAKIPRSGRS